MNSHLHFLITEESILASVVKQPQEIIVQRRKVWIRGGWSTFSQWSDCRHTGFRRALCGTALSCWRITRRPVSSFE